MQQAQQHTKDLEAIQQLADRFRREAEQAQAAAASARADAEQARCEAEQARCEGAMAARRAEQAEEGLRMAKEQVTGSLIAPDCIRFFRMISGCTWLPLIAPECT